MSRARMHVTIRHEMLGKMEEGIEGEAKDILRVLQENIGNIG